MLENQFGGWSQCINRFSWFKRTFAQIRRDIAAEVDCDKLNRDLSRFQGFIGARDRRHTRTRTRDTEHAALIAPPERMRARRRASSIHPAALCPQIVTRPCIRTLSRLLVSVGDSSYPIGMHMTGPLRAAVKKAPGHERLLVACAFQLGASAEGSAGTPLPGAAALAAANLLRPLPYLLYLADGDSGDSYNVFTAQKSARRAHAHAHAHTPRARFGHTRGSSISPVRSAPLIMLAPPLAVAPLQKVFKKHQMVDCSPPAALSTELGLPAGHPVHLGTVLTRCPHYLPSMRTKWGMPKGAADDEACCVLA